MPLASNLLFSFVANATALGAYLADFSDTHLFNPAWPSHAKYHAGHTMLLSVILSALTLFFSWRSGGDALTNLLAAAGFASVYWVTQAGAILYPNTLYFDLAFDFPKTYIHGLPAQAMFQIVFLSLTGIGGILGLRSILPDMQTGAFQGARAFARFDERGRIMPHAWQQAQHIFGHRDGGKPRQQVAVDGIEQEQRARKQDPRHLCHQLAFNRSSQLVAQAAVTAQNMVPSARHQTMPEGIHSIISAKS